MFINVYVGGNVSNQFKYNRPWRKLWVLLMVGLLTAVTQTVWAHTRVEVGPYAIVVGWVEEPAIVGERNALELEITEDEIGVTGVEADLNAELTYAGRTFQSNLNPTTEPGVYTVEIFPTVRGQYAVHLSGSIGDVAVDETIEPEEVFPASRIQFPEAQPEPRELQTQVDELTTQLAAARTLSYVGIGVGVLGILLAVVALLRRRSA
jgi:hypothetical protein